MTTAARPTFDPARGGQGRGEKDLSAISVQYSSRDLPSHTKLKYREPGQGTVDELRSRNFRKELEEREGEAQASSKPRRLAIEAAEPAAKKSKTTAQQAAVANLDADDPVDDSDSEASDDDDEDDTEALMAELQRIRKERADDLVKKELQKRQDDDRIRTENILHGNPLLSYAAAKSGKTDMKVRRGWDDDVVFKNCARSEPKKRHDFINDSLRSEFHKKFLEKYVK